MEKSDDEANDDRSLAADSSPSRSNIDIDCGLLDGYAAPSPKSGSPSPTPRNGSLDVGGEDESVELANASDDPQKVSANGDVEEGRVHADNGPESSFLALSGVDDRVIRVLDECGCI